MDCNEFNSYKMLFNHKLDWVVYALVIVLQIIKRALTVFQSCLYGHYLFKLLNSFIKFLFSFIKYKI